ncbi:GntR family transcriptional regulator [Isoptericola sp. NPDC057191]|uniref:GntR family transcriptional regulator n=1 Tax=Isoptericola sp. NPDC057191 TaxID=3346041 RepID=UPI003644D0D5
MPLGTQPTTGRVLLRDEVYRAIVDAIIDGTLEPGEVLKDDELMHWLNVSRTPVRQALNRLSSIGLVEMSPGRFTKVTELDRAFLNQSLYAAGVLCLEAVRPALERVTPQWLDEIDGHYDTAAAAVGAEDSPSAGRAICRFFLAFGHASGNAVLVTQLDRLVPRLLRYMSRPETLADLQATLPRCDAIRVAAREHDPDTIRSLVRGLIEEPRQNFAATYRRAGRRTPSTR